MATLARSLTALITAACLTLPAVPAHAELDYVQGGVLPAKNKDSVQAQIENTFEVFLFPEDCNVLRSRHKNDRTTDQAKATIWAAHVEYPFRGLKKKPVAYQQAFDRAYAKHLRNYFAKTTQCGITFSKNSTRPAPKPAPKPGKNTPAPAGLTRTGSGGSSFSS